MKFWYDCPYEGGAITVINYGGEISCRPRAADIVCIGAVEDVWPAVTGLSSRTAKPGENITVRGYNLNTNSTLRVTIHVDCPSVVVIGDKELVVTLPSNDKFNSVVQMGLYAPRRFAVIVTDSEGRTSHLSEALVIEMNLDGSDFASFFGSLGVSTTVLTLVAVILVLVICSGCLVWCYCSWRKVEQKQAYHLVQLKL